MKAQSHRHEECERAVLEQGGTLSFIAKKPSLEESRYNELIARFDALAKELAHLRALQEKPNN